MRSSIKDVRKERMGLIKCRGKGPCWCLQASAFVLLFQFVLRMLSMGDAYVKIVNCYSSCTICATEYIMGWQ